MPERVEIKGEEEQQAKPARKLAPGEKLRLVALRVGVALIALAILVWFIHLAAGWVTTGRVARQVRRQLQAGASTGTGVEAQVRAFGATLSPRQVRTLVAGRSLKYQRLAEKQRKLFAAIKPLPGPHAPSITPYQVRLDEVSGGRELRLVWAADSGGQAVVSSARL
jgi:hypothetical protein